MNSNNITKSPNTGIQGNMDELDGTNVNAGWIENLGTELYSIANKLPHGKAFLPLAHEIVGLARRESVGFKEIVLCEDVLYRVCLSGAEFSQKMMEDLFSHVRRLKIYFSKISISTLNAF